MIQLFRYPQTFDSSDGCQPTVAGEGDAGCKDAGRGLVQVEALDRPHGVHQKAQHVQFPSCDNQMVKIKCSKER